MNGYFIHHRKLVLLYMALILSKIESPFATSGFNDWKHSNVIVEHENGENHHKCTTAYLIRHEEIGSVDSLLLKHHHSEQAYWQKVLTHVVSVICFLASRGLPFHGENQIIGSAKKETIFSYSEAVD